MCLCKYAFLRSVVFTQQKKKKHSLLSDSPQLHQPDDGCCTTLANNRALLLFKLKRDLLPDTFHLFLVMAAQSSVSEHSEERCEERNYFLLDGYTTSFFGKSKKLFSFLFRPTKRSWHLVNTLDCFFYLKMIQQTNNIIILY